MESVWRASLELDPEPLGRQLERYRDPTSTMVASTAFVNELVTDAPTVIVANVLNAVYSGEPMEALRRHAEWVASPRRRELSERMEKHRPWLCEIAARFKDKPWPD